jgi:hypothetical protein
MGRPKTEFTEQLVTRVTPDLRERLKDLTKKMTPHYFATTVTDITRLALLRGVEALEKELVAREDAAMAAEHALLKSKKKK